MRNEMDFQQRKAAGLLAQQYSADELQRQLTRSVFLTALGKVLFWMSMSGFLIVSLLMAGDILFLGSTTEKIVTFLRFGGASAIACALFYHAFLVTSPRTMAILTEAYRIRVAAERMDAALTHRRNQ